MIYLISTQLYICDNHHQALYSASLEERNSQVSDEQGIYLILKNQIFESKFKMNSDP